MPVYGISITLWDEDKDSSTFTTYLNVALEADAITRANALVLLVDALSGGIVKRLSIFRELPLVGVKSAPVAGIDIERGLKMVFGSTMSTVHPELTIPGILSTNVNGDVVEPGGKLDADNADWDAFFDELFGFDYEDYRGGDLILLEDNYETFEGKRRKK